MNASADLRNEPRLKSLIVANKNTNVIKLFDMFVKNTKTQKVCGSLLTLFCEINLTALI